MGGMFRKYEPGQAHLFPPSPRDWLPDDHLVHFVSDTIDALDLAEFERRYRESGTGMLAYSPQLMLRLLVYGYCTGVTTSRQIAKAIVENVAFRYLAAGHAPSHRSIRRFRQRHIDLFESVFAQVVQVAMGAGLVKMGTLAIDGTKMKAAASKHRAMSYGRMKEEEKRLKKQIREITRAAEEQDEIDDDRFGPNFRGDELPEELARREMRREAIRKAMKEVEERRKQADADEIEKRKKLEEQGRKPRKRKHPLGKPQDTDQYNFTDPDSRIMKASSGGFEQSYNAQLAVDDTAQIIVAAGVSQSAVDNPLLVPVLESVMENTGAAPRRTVADSGYRSEATFAELEGRGIDAYVSLGREGQAKVPPPSHRPASRRMHRKLNSKRGRRTYAKRKHIVEPVIGWIRRCLRFQSFNLRGVASVTGEWHLACLAINIRRMSERIRWA